MVKMEEFMAIHTTDGESGDILGKYIQKMMQPNERAAPQSTLTLDFLRENGF